MGYPGAEVGRFLGVTTSAVNRQTNFGDILKFNRCLKVVSEPTDFANTKLFIYARPPSQRGYPQRRTDPQSSTR